MSYGDQRLYLYRDTIDLVVTTTSMYVDNRPMNNKKLKAHKGVSNEIYFSVTDRDRKKQNVFNDTIRAYMVNPGTGRRILTRTLEHTADVGLIKLVLTESDLGAIDAGLYQLYLTRSETEQTDLPIFTDQDSNIKFDIDITDQASMTPIATQSADTFIQSGNTVIGDAANSFVTSALYGNLERNFDYAQHTMAIHAQGYTGQVQIQASCISTVPDSDDESPDWFTVETLDIADPQTTGNIVVSTFTVNCNWVRVLHYPTTGSISKIQLRN